MCPTCSHTMQSLGVLDSGDRAFWCPRCGTIKRQFNKHEVNEATQLVSRCHAFREIVLAQVEDDDQFIMNGWMRCGVSECISPESERSK
jgi:tRNA(Ile2) C34 agmatinyltransferase TiaS